jgi:hypothetical protein
MVSDSPDMVLIERANRLSAALSQLDRVLDDLAADADPDAVAEALAAPVLELNAAAKEALA